MSTQFVIQSPVVMADNKKHKSYFIDSSIYIFRAWFVLPDDLTDPAGNSINALLGFSDFVYQLLKQEQPAQVAFAFDQSLKSSYRNEIYPAYKANRKPAPAELKNQFIYCRELIKHIGLSHFVSERYEADDIIGALCADAYNNNRQSIIITADKDLTQLVREDDIWWDFAKNNRMTARCIEKKFGVKPEQISDLLAITGDKVDNIPGVPGVGTRTAAKLLSRFGNIDTMLEQTDLIGTMKFRGAKRIQDLITEHYETILLARKLTSIHSAGASVDITPVQKHQPDISALKQFFNNRGFSPSRQERWFRLLEEPLIK